MAESSWAPRGSATHAGPPKVALGRWAVQQIKLPAGRQWAKRGGPAATREPNFAATINLDSLCAGPASLALAGRRISKSGRSGRIVGALDTCAWG